MRLLASWAELVIACSILLACTLHPQPPPPSYVGRVLRAENHLSRSGELVKRLTVEWECGVACHQTFTGDFPIPSREAALGQEGGCVEVSFQDSGILRLTAC